MCKLRYILPSSVLYTLYFSLIYPYLSYCLIVWGSASTSMLHKLFMLQKRAIRIVARSHYVAASNPLFARLNMLKISDIYTFQVTMFVFKFLNFYNPISSSTYFTLNSVPAYVTRNSNVFVVPLFRTVIRERSIVIAGPRIWNNLPMFIRCCPSLGSFKRRMMSHLISRY